MYSRLCARVTRVTIKSIVSSDILSKLPSLRTHSTTDCEHVHARADVTINVTCKQYISQGEKEQRRRIGFGLVASMTSIAVSKATSAVAGPLVQRQGWPVYHMCNMHASAQDVFCSSSASSSAIVNHRLPFVCIFAMLVTHVFQDPATLDDNLMQVAVQVPEIAWVLCTSAHTSAI